MTAVVGNLMIDGRPFDARDPLRSLPSDDYADLPDQMRQARRWLVWRRQPRPGKKDLKVPHYVDGSTRGATDTPEDISHLATFDKALAALQTGRFTGLGFALGPDGTGNCWQGIDLDHLSQHPELAHLVDDLPGYTERSPSGDGVHAIGYGRPFRNLSSNASGIETYSAGRFFTVTCDGAGLSDITCIAEFVERVLAPLHTRPIDKPSDAPVTVLDAATITDLRSALNHLRADDRELWIRMAMAAKSCGDPLRGVWLDWSATSEKFDPVDAARVWASCQPSHTGYQAIFAEAQRQGWVNPLARQPDSQRNEMTNPRHPGVDPANPLKWTEAFMLSKDEAAAISDPKWIESWFIVQGHLIVVVSEPNGGKTTILMYLAGRWSKKGYQVIYTNADTSASDAKIMVAQAERDGFQLLLPDMKAGLSMMDVVTNLEGMAKSGGDFTNVIMIFDTLKKMTDVINKQAAKGLYRTLRALTAKGMTVICLAHTNKYVGTDGKPIFEGTGDLRADFDELVYLIPLKNDDGSMTVSTDPDKVRAALKPITFDISPERIVTQRANYVDVAGIREKESQREKDQATIEAIVSALETRCSMQIDIIVHCKSLGFPRNTVVAVLKRYKGELWRVQKGFQKNRYDYRLIDESAPPGELGTGISGETRITGELDAQDTDLHGGDADSQASTRPETRTGTELPSYSSSPSYPKNTSYQLSDGSSTPCPKCLGDGCGWCRNRA